MTRTKKHQYPATHIPFGWITFLASLHIFTMSNSPRWRLGWASSILRITTLWNTRDSLSGSSTHFKLFSWHSCTSESWGWVWRGGKSFNQWVFSPGYAWKCVIKHSFSLCTVQDLENLFLFFSSKFYFYKVLLCSPLHVHVTFLGGTSSVTLGMKFWSYLAALMVLTLYRDSLEFRGLRGRWQTSPSSASWFMLLASVWSQSTRNLHFTLLHWRRGLTILMEGYAAHVTTGDMQASPLIPLPLAIRRRNVSEEWKGKNHTHSYRIPIS